MLSSLIVVGLLSLAAVLWFLLKRPGPDARRDLVNLVSAAVSSRSALGRLLPLPDNSVFISYRRQDSQDIVGRLDDHLAMALGRNAVFKDVASMKPGQDFRHQIESSLEACKVFICMIGEQWSGGNEPGRRRIDDPADYVRLEVETAIARKVPIIPVLVRGVRMPESSSFPESLRDICYLHALPLRADPDFHNDFESLLNNVADIIGSRI